MDHRGIPSRTRRHREGGRTSIVSEQSIIRAANAVAARLEEDNKSLPSEPTFGLV
jgi:hypothetical protein